MATKTTVPLASANIAFFWKMKQIAIIDQADTETSHKVKQIYVLRKSNGTTTDVAIWVDTNGLTGAKQLNMDVIAAVPAGYVNKLFAFDDDECSLWLDKASADTQSNNIVIGTGDIRGLTLNPPNPGAAVTCISLDVDMDNPQPVILHCPNDYQVRTFAPSIPATPDIIDL